MTICENCCGVIDEAEVQKCHLCEMDGLGNCCIGIHDHDCQIDYREGKEPQEISTAAVLANWHKRTLGKTRMRPGVRAAEREQEGQDA